MRKPPFPSHSQWRMKRGRPKHARGGTVGCVACCWRSESPPADLTLRPPRHSANGYCCAHPQPPPPPLGKVSGAGAALSPLRRPSETPTLWHRPRRRWPLLAAAASSASRFSRTRLSPTAPLTERSAVRQQRGAEPHQSPNWPQRHYHAAWRHYGRQPETKAALLPLLLKKLRLLPLRPHVAPPSVFGAGGAAAAPWPRALCPPTPCPSSPAQTPSPPAPQQSKGPPRGLCGQ